MLTVLAAALPAAGWEAQGGGFHEPADGSSGRRADTGIHESAGAALWTTSLPDDPDYLLRDRDGNIVALGSAGITSLDSATGAVRWTSDLDGDGLTINGRCHTVAEDGTIWAMSDARRIVGLDPDDGTIVGVREATAGGVCQRFHLLPDNHLAYWWGCCEDGPVILDLDGGDSYGMPVVEGTEREINFILTSPDGSRMYLASRRDDRVTIESWDWAGQRLIDSVELVAGSDTDQFVYYANYVDVDGGLVLSTGLSDSLVDGHLHRILDDGSGQLSLDWTITAFQEDIEDAADPFASSIDMVRPIGPGGRIVLAQDTSGHSMLTALDLDTGQPLYRFDPGGWGADLRFGSVDEAGNAIVPHTSGVPQGEGRIHYSVFSPSGRRIGGSGALLGAAAGTNSIIVAPDVTYHVASGTVYALTSRPGVSDPPLSISPSVVGATDVVFTLTGIVALTASEIVLVAGDARYTGVVDPVFGGEVGTARAFVDLTGAPLGSYAVRYVRGGLEVDSGLDVTVVEPDEKSPLEVVVNGPGVIRNGRSRPVTVEVTNTSNVSVQAVPLAIEANLPFGDPRTLSPDFDITHFASTEEEYGIDVLRQLEGLQQVGQDRAGVYVIGRIEPGETKVLPFTFDVPADAPALAETEIRAAVPECMVEESPGAEATFAGAFLPDTMAECVAATAGLGVNSTLGIAGLLADAAEDAGMQALRINPITKCVVGIMVDLPNIIDDLSGVGGTGLENTEAAFSLLEIGLSCYPPSAAFGAGLGIANTILFDCGGAEAILELLTGSSVDPNEIAGPSGAGDARYVTSTGPLPYRISFENLADAAFAAQEVVITQTLDPALDPASLRLSSFGWGGRTFDAADGGVSGYERVFALEGADHRVRVSMAVNGRDVEWRFETLALDADEPPADDLIGFLPPNQAPPEGDGFVAYTIRPVAGVAEGQTATAVADITFDVNDPIVTNTWSNTFDLTPPATTLDAVPTPSPHNTVTLRYTSVEATSGIADNLLDLDDGVGEPVTRSVGPEGSTTVTAPRGATFTATVRGVDGAGNVESADTAPSQDITIANDAVDRVAGDNRILTAIEISRSTFAASGTVVLARAETFPDAIAGAPVAAALGAPILLAQGTVPNEVEAELDRLGAQHMILLGGTAALPDAVEQRLLELGYTTERIAGPDRFATATEIAGALAAGRAPDDRATRAFLTQARGTSPEDGFADALSVAPWAALAGTPLLLTESTFLSQPTADYLAGSAIDTVTIVGSEAEVSAGVVAELKSIGLSVDRIDGPDRYARSVTTSAMALEAGAGDPFITWIATGEKFPDALAAGAGVAASGGRLLLVHGEDINQSPGALDPLGLPPDEMGLVRLVGGTAAVNDQVEQAIRQRLAMPVESTN